MRKDNRFRIFPEYFDRNVSRRSGRRLPVPLSLNGPPSLIEIKIAAQKMNLEPEVNKDVCHPAFSTGKRGMVLVNVPQENKLAKLAVLKRLSQLITSFARPAIEQELKKKTEELKKSHHAISAQPHRKIASDQKRSDSSGSRRPRRR